MSWELFKNNLVSKLSNASNVPSIEYVAKAFADEYDRAIKNGGTIPDNIKKLLVIVIDAFNDFNANKTVLNISSALKNLPVVDYQPFFLFMNNGRFFRNYINCTPGRKIIVAFPVE